MVVRLVDLCFLKIVQSNVGSHSVHIDNAMKTTAATEDRN